MKSLGALGAQKRWSIVVPRVATSSAQNIGYWSSNVARCALVMIGGCTTMCYLLSGAFMFIYIYNYTCTHTYIYIYYSSVCIYIYIMWFACLLSMYMSGCITTHKGNLYQSNIFSRWRGVRFAWNPFSWKHLLLIALFVPSVVVICLCYTTISL